MVEFEKLTIQGFRSFTYKQEIDLTQYKGFVFVTGENKVEPSLGGNGVGKSSLFEALVFVLYGKISTNLTASNIANWTSNNNCEVSLYFKVNSVDYNLIRTWSPNTLILNEEIITQEQIDDLLNCNYTTFLFNVFIAQFTNKFLDLSPAEKLQVFSKIIGDELSKWDKYSIMSTTKSIEYSVICKDIEDKINNMKGRISTLESTSYLQDVKDYNINKKKQIKAISDSIKNKDKDYEETAKTMEYLTDLIFKMNDTIQDSKEELEEGKKEIKKLEGEIKDTAYSIREKEVEIKRLKESLNFFDMNKTCPVCEQEIEKAFRKNKVKEIEKEIKEVWKLHSILCKEELDNSERLSKLTSEIRKKKESLDKIIMHKSELEKELAIAGRDAEKHGHEMLNLQNRIKEIEKEDNPFIKKEEERNKLLSFSKTQLECLSDLLLENKTKVDEYEYWTDGFKKIKLLVIQKALEELEMYINNILSNFGMVGWNVKLDIESTTKKDTIKSGFSVLVESPHNKELVPFSVWSGGERQRLRLAGQIGLINFISNYKGLHFNIEIWDEPSAWLSDTGIQSFINVLKDRSITTGKSIFLIDHKDLYADGIFDDIITIVKTKEGSIYGQGLNCV